MRSRKPITQPGSRKKILALLAHEREAITNTLDWKIPISVNLALLGPASGPPTGRPGRIVQGHAQARTPMCERAIDRRRGSQCPGCQRHDGCALRRRRRPKKPAARFGQIRCGFLTDRQSGLRRRRSRRSTERAIGPVGGSPGGLRKMRCGAIETVTSAETSLGHDVRVTRLEPSVRISQSAPADPSQTSQIHTPNP